MKLKYYLRGLGTGILFATIILFISYSYKMSDSQIKKKASELGMIYPDKETSSNEVTTSKKDDNKTSSSEMNTQENKEENTTDKVSSEDSSSDEESTKDTAKEESTEENTTTKEEQTEKPTEEETTNKRPEKTYELTVTSKTNSWDVAKKLKNAGIIDDAEEFNDYLCDNGHASNIQNGKFTITSDMSYKEIAKIITSKPKKD